MITGTFKMKPQDNTKSFQATKRTSSSLTIATAHMTKKSSGTKTEKVGLPLVNAKCDTDETIL